jgi:hypothetical protein
MRPQGASHHDHGASQPKGVLGVEQGAERMTEVSLPADVTTAS